MYRQRTIDFIVGLFIIAGVIALIVLAFKVSGLTTYSPADSFKVTADFTNIGDLKDRAPVTVAGVTIGRVTSVKLNPVTYKAVVTMQIKNVNNQIPTDSTASILTAGLLGANYIEITPGFDNTFLKNDGKIEKTNQALILQNLIGKLMFNIKDKKK